MSAAQERGGRRALTRLARALVIVLVSGIAGIAPLTAVAAVSEDEPVAAQLDVLAAPTASGIVRDGDALTVRVTLSNAGQEATGALAVELRIDGSRPADRADLAEWFADAAGADGAVADSQPVARATVSALEPGASAVLDLTIAASGSVVSGPFGARLAEVSVSDSEGTVSTDRTAVVFVPAAAQISAAPTIFVAAFTTPGVSDGLVPADTLATLTAPSGALTRTLDATAGRPVLLAIDPRIIASVRVLADQAPPSALAFLDRLAAAPNETFLLPWADADPVATLAAVQTPLPRPEGSGVLGAPPPGGDSATPNSTPSASPSAGADDDAEGAETTQSLTELAQWNATFRGMLWTEPDGITAQTLDALRADGANVVITPSTALESENALQKRGELTLVRADYALADAARDAARASSQQLFDRSMARVSAVLAATVAADPGAPIVVALGREPVTGSDRMLDTIAQSISLPWSIGGTASDALTAEAAPASVLNAPSDPQFQAAVEAALEAEAADRQFAQIAVTPALITDDRRLRLLAALSLGWGGDSTTALQSFVAEAERLRSAVQVVDSSAILLLTDRASLPVTVQNDLAVAVRVFVRVEPDTARLRVLDSDVETLVEPLSQSRSLVPVQSLTNGEVDITVTVRDAQDRILSEPTRVSLNLQAGWETAGTIIVAVAVTVLFITGIVRDLRKRRRRATVAAIPDADADEETP